MEILENFGDWKHIQQKQEILILIMTERSAESQIELLLALYTLPLPPVHNVADRAVEIQGD